AYRQAAHFAQVVEPGHIATGTLSGLGDRISGLVIRRLAEPPPEMGGENIPTDEEAKLPGALTALAPSAGLESPLTLLAPLPPSNAGSHPVTFRRTGAANTAIAAVIPARATIDAQRPRMGFRPPGVGDRPSSADPVVLEPGEHLRPALLGLLRAITRPVVCV